MKTSMDDANDVLFQGYLFQLKQGKSGRFGRTTQDRWKNKYFMLLCQEERLFFNCYKKKPKYLRWTKPKKQISLCPSFKVEKLTNAFSRSFAVDLTSPSGQLCLSSDNRSDLSKLVFLLQTQFTLKESNQTNIIEVKTEQSEAFTELGAKGANCIMHVSPWGITLALRKSFAVLAQWPLKSIRFYESSGQGQFVIEAGRVAPMGEGIYTFHTRLGLDNKLYDSVDHFVISTLDRVKPSQRGTTVEIEDYIRELDCLHSLLELKPRVLSSIPEVAHLLQINWNLAVSSSGDNSAAHAALREGSVSGTEGNASVTRELLVSSSVIGSSPVRASENRDELQLSPQISRPQTGVPPEWVTSPVSVSPKLGSPPAEFPNKNSPLKSSSDSPGRRGPPVTHQRLGLTGVSSSSHSRSGPGMRGETSKPNSVASRPPATPPRSVLGPGRLGKVPSQASQSDFVDGAVSHCNRGPPPRDKGDSSHRKAASQSSPSRSIAKPPVGQRSVLASIAGRLSHDESGRSAIQKQMSCDSNASVFLDSESSNCMLRSHVDSPGSPDIRIISSGNNERVSCPVTVNNTPSESSSFHQIEAPLEDWLVSASCEDLSDHMRAIVFQKQQCMKGDATDAMASAQTEHAIIKAEQNSKTQNDESKSDDPGFIPPPFTNIIGFRCNSKIEVPSSDKLRDRSQSFDVNARHQVSPCIRKRQNCNPATGTSGVSNMSIRQIRKMVSAQAVTKETLRKSLSNPNFLNLGSKEKLNQMRVAMPVSQLPPLSKNSRRDSSHLSIQTKHKSKSLASLLPNTLLRYISRESLTYSQSSSVTPSPDLRNHKQRHNRQHRDSSDDSSSGGGSLQRQRSLREMSVKGIHFTERSRSFRKPKVSERSKSADPFRREEHLDRVLPADNLTDLSKVSRLSADIKRSSGNSLSASAAERRSDDVSRKRGYENLPMPQHDSLGDTYLELNSRDSQENRDTGNSAKQQTTSPNVPGQKGTADSANQQTTSQSVPGQKGTLDTTSSNKSQLGSSAACFPQESEWKIRLPSRTTSQSSC